MATVTATAEERALSATLSGTTADTVQIGGWPYLEIVNRDSSVDLWFSVLASVTSPASGTNGSHLVRPGECVLVENPCFDPTSLSARTTASLTLKGNGNAYAVRGVEDCD